MKERKAGFKSAWDNIQIIYFSSRRKKFGLKNQLI